MRSVWFFEDRQWNTWDWLSLEQVFCLLPRGWYGRFPKQVETRTALMAEASMVVLHRPEYEIGLKANPAARPERESKLRLGEIRCIPFRAARRAKAGPLRATPGERSGRPNR